LAIFATETPANSYFFSHEGSILDLFFLSGKPKEISSPMVIKDTELDDRGEGSENYCVRVGLQR